MSCGRRSTASRYSPKLSQDQSIPSSSTAPGMSSTPSISEMSRGCASARTGREADAAVAHDRGGHAVPARRRHPFVPRRLPVVMRMDVDEARGDQQPGGVDLLAAPAGDRAHGGDQWRRPPRRQPRRGSPPRPSATSPPRTTRSCAVPAMPCPSPSPAAGEIVSPSNYMAQRVATGCTPSGERVYPVRASVPSAARSPVRPMPSSAQSSASVVGVGHVAPGPPAVAGAAGEDAAFGRAVAVEGHGVRLDADGAAWRRDRRGNAAARRRRAARSARRRAARRRAPAGAMRRPRGSAWWRTTPAR